MRIIALFNLKPGVTIADYEAWAHDVDLPSVRGLPSITGFDVYRSTMILGSDAKPPYQYVEIIDVKDMDAFIADVSTPHMQSVAGQFQSMADVVFLLTEPLN